VDLVALLVLFPLTRGVRDGTVSSSVRSCRHFFKK
jgi:hypothetical protein